MTINTKLKEYLLQKGIKAVFITEKTGFTSSQLSNMLNGKRKITAEELSKICKALNVNAEIFFD